MRAVPKTYTQRDPPGKTAPGALVEQRAQQAGGVGVTACAGVVLRVGQHHGLRGADGQLERACHGLRCLQPVGAPLARLGGDGVQALDGRARARLVVAMAPDHRTTAGHVGGGETHRKAEGDAGFALDVAQRLVDLAGRRHGGALRIERDQEGQPPRMQRGLAAQAPALLQQPRGDDAGGGHVGVRIFAVGGQRIRLGEHALTDVGVQVQAGDDGHSWSGNGA